MQGLHLIHECHTQIRDGRLTLQIDILIMGKKNPNTDFGLDDHPLLYMERMVDFRP